MPLKKRRGGSLGNIRPKKACATLKKVTVTSPEAACAHISSNAGTSHLLNDEEEVEWIDGQVSGPWQDISAATDEDKLESQIDPVTGEIPDYFDANKMDMLELSQIGWWDETHQKCTIGGIGAGSVNPRDANGKIDLENGMYSLEERAELKVKYEAEVRLCLGCAAVVSLVLVDSVDRELVGKTAEPYCYSGKIFLSIKDYVIWQRVEMICVRGLTNRRGVWVIDPRPEGSIFQNDPTSILKKCGPLTQEKLTSQGINDVGAIRSLTDEQIAKVMKVTGLSVKLLRDLREKSSYAEDTDAPNIVDYRSSFNPYEAKYGADG